MVTLVPGPYCPTALQLVLAHVLYLTVVVVLAVQARCSIIAGAAAGEAPGTGPDKAESGASKQMYSIEVSIIATKLIV